MPVWRCSKEYQSKTGAAMGASILDAAEAGREVRPVLHRLELGLEVRVVIADVRVAMAFGHAEIDGQVGHGLAANAGAAIGVQGQGATGDTVACDRLLDERLGQACGFALGDPPAYDVTAEDVQDDVEVEAGPLTLPAP